MPIFVQIFRLFTLALIAGALVFAPMPGHSGHDVTALISVEDTAHGHDHDHPHLPGHDAADHSHQFLFLPDGLMQSAFAAANAWQLLAAVLPDPGIPTGLERPPRQA